MADNKEIESTQLLESMREIARSIFNNKQCNTFIPINRSRENRVDCYLFDSSLTQKELEEFFRMQLSSTFSVAIQEMNPELFLVKQAAIVVELLLKNYPKHEVLDKLFREHFHYVFNSLGHDYESEAQIYYQASKTLSEYAKGANASQQL